MRSNRWEWNGQIRHGRHALCQARDRRRDGAASGPDAGGAASGRRARRVLGAGLLLLALPLAAIWFAAPASAADLKSLRPSVVDLDVHRPGETPVRTYGFALEGVPGILACYRTVAGAEKVEVRTAAGGSFAVTDYVAAAPDLDLVVLRTPEAVPPLPRGSHLFLAPQQSAFVLLPPSVQQMDTYRVRFVTTFDAPVIGELIALWGDISTGLPVADSLGHVVGVIEALREESVFAVTAIPIATVDELLSRPDTGGSLSDLDPGRIAAWTRTSQPEGSQVMGTVLCRQFRFSSGLPFLTRAVQREPDLVEAKLEWGMAYQVQQEHEEAERLYREVLQQRPGYPRAHVYLGSNYFMQGRYAESKEQYELALDQDPGLALAHVNIGGVYYLDGNKAAAEASFKKAVELEPTMGLAHYNLGMVYAADGRTGEYQQTLELLERNGSGYAGKLRQGANSAGGD